MFPDCLILAPYYWALRLRHFLFDKGLRKVHRSPVPTVCVGNVTVGGTGKTPHTEMILRLLGEDPLLSRRRFGVLSRGYRRKTRGFLQVGCGDTADRSGDEPLQIKRKFPRVPVAVCSDRIDGCDRLSLYTDLIILDDAFQFRPLRADVNIVLTDWNRPVFRDHLLPLGRLRDLPSRLSDADILIVSKCPSVIDDTEREEWARDLGLESYDLSTGTGRDRSGKLKELYFTTIAYDALQPAFPQEADLHFLYSNRMILLTGIADDRPLQHYLQVNYRMADHMALGDHHRFSAGDFARLAESADRNPTAIIVTTEKDRARLPQADAIPPEVRRRLFYAPIQAQLLTPEEEERFREHLRKVCP